jgi:hypothetical protein
MQATKGRECIAPRPCFTPRNGPLKPIREEAGGLRADLDTETRGKILCLY